MSTLSRMLQFVATSHCAAIRWRNLKKIERKIVPPVSKEIAITLHRLLITEARSLKKYKFNLCWTFARLFNMFTFDEMSADLSRNNNSIPWITKIHQMLLMFSKHVQSSADLKQFVSDFPLWTIQNWIRVKPNLSFLAMKEESVPP